MFGTLGGGATRSSEEEHFKEQYGFLKPFEILELEDLINDPRVREEELQRFFESHPQLFRIWDYRDILPHVFLTREADGPFIPDFLLVDPDLQKAMILDLKLPQGKIVRDQRNRRRFSTALTEARAQLLEYRDWFEERTNVEHAQRRLTLVRSAIR